jgi:glycine/D-amino acid oxidase-like deaminating enzyme
MAPPLWLDRAGPDVPRYSPLRRTEAVDVAIVGGGVTGAAVGWMLSSAGMRVAILERQRVGRGSTAASTALLMQEPDEDFGALRERYGTAATTRIWSRSRQANRDFIETLTRLRVRCDLRSRDSVYYTSDESRRLEHELRMRQRAGLGGRWLNEAALARIANIAGTAIQTTGDAEANPYRVCIGLLRAAETHGARIFEHTRVTRIDTSGRDVVVHAGAGRIHAQQVIVATGYATPEFKPLLSRFAMQHTYVLATAPLSLTRRRRIGLSDVMLWDTGRPYHYARWTIDGRLILGGGDRPRVSGRARVRAFREGASSVRDYFTRLYPSLADTTFDYAWEGLFATTRDGLPYIGPHRRYPRHLFALGYGGNGMTFGFLAAQLIRERLVDGVTTDHELFAFGRRRR